MKKGKKPKIYIIYIKERGNTYIKKKTFVSI
jgi:hypothetical protein